MKTAATIAPAPIPSPASRRTGSLRGGAKTGRLASSATSLSMPGGAGTSGPTSCISTVSEIPAIPAII